MKFLPIALTFLFSPLFLTAQVANKKVLDPESWKIWKKISQQTISNDGHWVAYTLTNEVRNPEVELFDVVSQRTYIFPRAQKPQFSEDSQFLIFDIVPDRDTVRSMKSRKVKEEKLPKKSLGILNLKDQDLIRVPRVTAYTIPKYWSGYLAMTQDPIIDEASQTEEERQTHLLVWNFAKAKADTIPYIDKFVMSDRSPNMLISQLEKDSINPAAISYYNCTSGSLNELMKKEAKFDQLTISADGNQVAWLMDEDSTKTKVRPFDLYYWNIDENNPTKLSDNKTTFSKYRISEKGKIQFDLAGKRMYLGLANEPLLQDTTLLPEDIAKVEVWTTKDKRTYPQQKNRLNRDKNKTYEWFYDLSRKKFVQIEGEEYSTVNFSRKRTGDYVVLEDDSPGLLASSWEGFPIRKDAYSLNLNTGEKKKIISNLATRINISPKGKFAYWYNRSEDSWYSNQLKNGKTKKLAGPETTEFNNELHDTPIDQYSYGIAGWTKDDDRLLVYDRYDIWSLDPTGKKKPQKITNGRASKRSFRLIQLDRENQYFDPDETWLARSFNENNKYHGYFTITDGNKVVDVVREDKFVLSRSPLKARDKYDLVFSFENFETFPDLHFVPDLDFEESVRMSDANPQQRDYNWGSIELLEWKDYEGQKVEGLIVKPENFDPSKKYPLIVNFYERSSQGLHRHRAPYPHRSTINYSYYASRGYVIFNPDVRYTTGAPGESAYRAVMSGVDALLELGYVDSTKMALQGHSWGGYQIAYLLNRTNRFRCAESGAPVVNMTSAYGGIRWGSGLSRMFQYEKTQSRLGATLWENPKVYLDNSPLFDLEKTQTPVLIMHNDNDGAVPWYQGIEYFMALRRLGKPAWFLNYIGEPHWPLKRQNREDFQIRMSQFFDYFLQGKPMPIWMDEGVPAIEMGIDQGLELIEGDEH